MFAIFDHLTAIVVGTLLIVTLLTIQMRDRQTSINDTVNHTVRAQLYEAMDVVKDDVMNMRSPEQAETETGATGFSWSADTLTAGVTGLTSRFTFPASVQQDETMTNRSIGQVTYRLFARGGTVSVGGVQQPLHTLVREVAYSAAPTSVDTLSYALVDFRMGFISSLVADQTVWQGSAQPTTHSIHLSVSAARPGTDQLTGDVKNVGFTNAVSHGTVLEPTNL